MSRKEQEEHYTELTAVLGDIRGIQEVKTYIPDQEITWEEGLVSFLQSSLRNARQEGARKVAFPSIPVHAEGTGEDDAARIAVHAVREFLQEYPSDFDLIEWVIPDRKEIFLYTKAILGII